jgi:hypothetical protein
MQSFSVKQLQFYCVFIFILSFSNSCSLFNKNPTSVESAEKKIANDRRKKVKLVSKANRRAQKAHWARQSKATKKVIKRSVKSRRKNDKMVRQNYKQRQKMYGSDPYK